MNKTIKSHWNVDLSGRFIDNNSTKLCIILPGIGYLLERSYMDYSKKITLELGYDILEVEYGYQVSRSSFSPDNEFNIMLEETFKIVDANLNKHYQDILIIAKSIGTCIQIFLNEHLKNKNITNICLSPVDRTVEIGMLENSLVVSGLSDPLLSSENLNKIKKVKGIDLITIDNANHSFDIKNNIIKTLDALKDVILKEKDFIQKHSNIN